MFLYIDNQTGNVIRMIPGHSMWSTLKSKGGIKPVAVMGISKRMFVEYVIRNKVNGDLYKLISSDEEVRGREFKRIEFSFDWEKIKECEFLKELIKTRIR